jgi:hypothetical protein
MTPRNKLIAGVATIALLAGSGATFAAMELAETHSAAHLTPPHTVGARIDRFGLGGRLGGRGFAGGLGLGARLGVSFEAFGGELNAATAYLGVSEGALQTNLAEGRSLAQVAKAHGKDVDGLVNAITAEFTKRLDAAVAAGRIGKARAQRVEAGLTRTVTRLVNGTRLGVPFGRMRVGAATLASTG